MHKFLRATGFSVIQKRKEMDYLVRHVIKEADEQSFVSTDNDTLFADFKRYFGKNMGICVRGEYDEDGTFFVEYVFPFAKGIHISSRTEVEVERHIEKESYSAIFDESGIGISVIFYLYDVVPYLKRKNTPHISELGNAVCLSALSTEGVVVLPLEKDEEAVIKSNKYSDARKQLIDRARRGDEEAIDTLALTDMDTYSNVTRMVVKQDVLSLVDTYFMPCGVECDQYSILGEIINAEEVENELTKEKVWQMSVSVNDMTMDVCINKKDLLGEPEPGRRFKGIVWLMGEIIYPD